MEKRKTPQPRAAPAPAFPGGGRPKANAGRGAAGLRGLLARRPVRRVLLVTAVKIFFQTDIPEALAPAVLQAAACDVALRLHGEPAQAFRPGGTPNVKPTGQHHLCSHKWRVEYELGAVYLTISRHSLHEGRRLPYVFVQGSMCSVVGVAHLFDP